MMLKALLVHDNSSKALHPDGSSSLLHNFSVVVVLVVVVEVAGQASHLIGHNNRAASKNSESPVQKMAGRVLQVMSS